MAKKILPLFFLALLLIINLSQAHGAGFSTAYLRLDNQSVSSALSGTVCVSPSTAGAGTEAKIAVTFPSGFSINQTVSNWTTSTTNLPSNSSAMPGITSTAQSVSGQTVTFGISDLTSSSTTYCFNFTGNSSTTSSSTGNDKNGTIATQTSSNSVIDSTTYAVSIVSNNQLNVTAAVAASPTDFNSSLSKTSPTGTTVGQDTAITYQISYGSNLSYNSNITVEAQWYQGTITGNSSPSVDTVSYVIGSAGNAYNSTSPVIDDVNKKIDWTINSFPGSTTNQTVSFQLKTTSNYTGSSVVSFPVSARVLGPGATTADSTVTLNYQYNYGVSSAPTSTPTPGPTSTPTPGPTTAATPTSTPAPSTAKFSIDNVSVNQVLQKSATVSITTNNPSTKKVIYGSYASNLNQSVNVLTSAKGSSVTFDGLAGSTQYYFRVIATDATGQNITSDLFTFTTASSPVSSVVNAKTLILTSQNNILVAPSSNTNTNTAQPETSKPVVLPTNSDFTFQFTVENRENIKKVEAFVRSSNILGIFDPLVANTSERTITLIEVRPGVFSGRLTIYQPGSFTLFAKVFDYKGNIAEQKIIDIKNVLPFRIVDKQTKNPIEKAEAFLYLLTADRMYSFITPQVMSITNPTFSDVNGVIAVVLPATSYRVKISAQGYNDKTVDFTIGEGKDENYPQVELDPKPFNFITFGEILTGTVFDLTILLNNAISNLATSLRILALIYSFILLSFVLVTLLAFSARTHINLFHLPRYFAHHLNPSYPGFYTGYIFDEKTKKPLSQVRIIFFETESGRTIAQTLTDKSGKYIASIKNAKDFFISIVKEGYKEVHLQKNPFVQNFEPIFIVSQDTGRKINIGKTLIALSESVFGFFFEILLINSVIFELLFIKSFGFINTLPFFILSIFTVFLWIFYKRSTAVTLEQIQF